MDRRTVSCRLSDGGEVTHDAVLLRGVSPPRASAGNLEALPRLPPDLTFGWGLGYDARERLGVRLDFATLPPNFTARRRDQYTLSGWLKI
jgi:hypothetical protein